MLTKNKLEALAFENIEELKEESGGVIGKSEAKYIADENFKVIYFTDDNEGYIGVSDNVENLKEFFSVIYENVFIDI